MRLRHILRMVSLLVGPLVWQAGSAHSPHDNVEALAVAADDHGNAVIFAIVSKNQLLTSTDGGVFWNELVRGLDTAHFYTDVAAVSAAGDSNTVLLATDGDGIFRSDDLGRSWGRSSTGLTELRITRLRMAPDFTASGVAYALSRTGTVFRSSDHGASWTAIDFRIGPVSALAFRGEKASEGLWLGTTHGRIATSGGETHEARTLYDSSAAGIIRDIAVVPRLAELPLVLAGTEKAGILRSTDDGAGFATMNAGVSGSDITAIGHFDGEGKEPVIVALGWHDAAFVSSDAGETWTLSSTGLTTDPQATVPEHYSPQFMDFAVAESPDGGRVLLIAGFDGFFRSEDDGNTWRQYQTNLPGIFDTMALSPALDDDFCVAIATYGAGVFRKCESETEWRVFNRGLNELRLAAVAHSATYAEDGILVVGGPTTMFTTERGMRGWRRIDLDFGWFDRASRRTLRWLHHQAGLPRSMTLDLLTHPLPPFLTRIALPEDFANTRKLYATSRRDGVLYIDAESGTAEVLRERQTFTQDILLSPDFAVDGTLFVSARDDGIWKSTDRGATWTDANEGLKFLEEWRAARADPARNQELEISPSYEIKLAMSPGFATDATLFAGTSAGLFRSRDAGSSWEAAGTGLGPQPVFVAAIAVSNDFPQDRVVMVSVPGRGLFVSEDGGDSFRPASPEDALIGNFRLRNIALSPRFSDDGKVFVASDRHLLVSHDRGIHWRVAATPLRLEGLREVIRFEGKWGELRDPAFSGAHAWFTDTPGSRISAPVHGTGLRVYGAAGPTARYAVTLDGEQVATAKLVSTSADEDSPWLALDGLACASHLLELELIDVGEGTEAGRRGLVLDAIDVIGHTCDYDR